MVGVTDVVEPDDLHMTIIHSPGSDTDPASHGDVPLPRQVGLTRFNDPRTAVLGKAGSPGSLVVTYDSVDLANRHRHWRDDRGVKHSHEHFVPHMTLSYDASAIPQEVLARVHAHPCPVPIELVRERVAWCNP
jgi:2'-5' RNA ligase